MIMVGTPVCWGADPRWAELPILNLPPGALKVRRRIRSKCAATAFVKTAAGVQEWVLAQDGGGLKLAIQRGANVNL